MEAEVEVDDRPFSIAQPFVQQFNPANRCAAVDGWVKDVGSPPQLLSNGKGVTDRYGVTDEEDVRESRVEIGQCEGWIVGHLKPIEDVEREDR